MFFNLSCNVNVSYLLQPSPWSLQNKFFFLGLLSGRPNCLKKPNQPKKTPENHVSAVFPEHVQQRAIRMIKGLKHPFVGMGWKAVSIQHGPDYPRDLTDVYKYMMTGNKEDGARLFLQADSGKAILFFSFPVRVARHWYRMPREIVESPSLEILEIRLDTCYGLLLPLSWAGWFPEFPAKISCFTFQWYLWCRKWGDCSVAIRALIILHIEQLRVREDRQLVSAAEMSSY